MAMPNVPREFSITPPRLDSRLAVLLLIALPELIVLFVIFMVLREPHAIPKFWVPSVDVHQLIALPIAILFFAFAALLFWAVQRRRIILTGDMLEITATFYHRKQVVGAFDLDAARIINIDEHKQWRPFLKANGLDIGGLRAGWFRSRNFTKEFCLMTSRDRVLVLPERAGGATLLSVRQPQELLDALRLAADVSRNNHS